MATAQPQLRGTSVLKKVKGGCRIYREIFGFFFPLPLLLFQLDKYYDLSGTERWIWIVQLGRCKRALWIGR